MRAVVQRVSRARVTVDEEVVGKIGYGLVILVAYLATSIAFSAEVNCGFATLTLFLEGSGFPTKVSRDFGELVECRFQILDDLGGDNVRWWEIG